MMFEERYKVCNITRGGASRFLARHHYLSQQGAGFMASVEHGLFDQDLRMIGVIVWSWVSAPETLIGAFEGFDRTSDQSGVWELSRLAMDDAKKEKNLTSWFVARSIRILRKQENVRAIISYADSRYHHGYIYQATNFRYYGMTHEKNDFFEVLPDGREFKVTRGRVRDLKGEWRARSRKHRYMIVYDKRLKVKWKEEPYPKGDNTEYALGAVSGDQIDIFELI